MKYFCINHLSESGLGDQLGTQFSRLHLIGEKLGLTYRHQPIEVFRSSTSSYYENVRASILKLKIVALKATDIHPFFVFFSKGFSGLERVLLKFDSMALINQKLVEFLGLNYSDILHAPMLEIDLKSIIESSSSIDDVNEKIRSKYRPEHETLVLTWSIELYGLSYKLDDIYNEGKTINYNSFLKNRYFLKHPHLLTQPEKILVVHFRGGDSIALDSPEGKIVVYSTFVKFEGDTNLNYESMGDRNRINYLQDRYLEVLKDIEPIVKQKQFHVVFISDGYEQTKHILARFLTNNYHSLTPSKRKALLDLIDSNLNEKLFQTFTPYVDTMIIGESFEKLKLSIRYLSLAQGVIFGSGGFAYYIHSLFRKDENSYLGHINEVNNTLVENFEVLN